MSKSFPKRAPISLKSSPTGMSDESQSALGAWAGELGGEANKKDISPRLSRSSVRHNSSASRSSDVSFIISNRDAISSFCSQRMVLIAYVMRYGGI